MKHSCKRFMLAALMGLAGANAFAFDITVENSQGMKMYYNYTQDGRELEVTNNNSDSRKGSYAGVVIIPEEVVYMNRARKVTSIGEEAFKNCSDMTSVTIPKTVTLIGHNAFKWCTGLTSITIPGSVTKIDIGAFWECSNLKSVTIEEGLTLIDGYAFNGCKTLTSVTIPNSVTEIGKDAFNRCNALASVTIGSGVTQIGNSAFDETGLTSVNIPDNVTSIGMYAFNKCKSLTSVTIGNGVNTIGGSAFAGCSALTSVTIGTGVKKMNGGAFAWCDALTSVHISDLSAWCCIQFENEYSNPLKIAHHLYLNGQEVKDLVIPDGTPTVNKYAFIHCSSLTSITIPSSVKYVGFNAFFGVDVATVDSKISSPFKIKGKADVKYSAFSVNTFNNATLYVPTGTIDAYKMTEGWKDFIFIEER